jgi:hypothetical protein
MSSNPPPTFGVEETLPSKTALNRTSLGEFAASKHSDWIIDGAASSSRVCPTLDVVGHIGTLDPLMVTVTEEVE